MTPTTERSLPARSTRAPLMHTTPSPPDFVRGQGTVLWDTDGRRYLDFLGGLAVTSLGHAHPAVAEALGRQARTLLHVSNLFGNVVGPGVAATLDRSDRRGSRAGRRAVFFTNSGAEATSAPEAGPGSGPGPGRHVVVSTWDSFHGRTLATLHATGQRQARPLRAAPEVSSTSPMTNI